MSEKKILLFDPFSIGHHIPGIQTLSNSFKKVGYKVLIVGNTNADNSFYGIPWEQKTQGKIGFFLFIKYLILIKKIVKKNKCRKIFIYCYDNIWYYMFLTFLLWWPFVYSTKTKVIANQFRTTYIISRAGLIEWSKMLVFRSFKLVLKNKFVLCTSLVQVCDKSKKLIYLPDIIQPPEEIIEKDKARLFLSLNTYSIYILFLGNIFDKRKGFVNFITTFNCTMYNYKILVTCSNDDLNEFRLPEEIVSKIICFGYPISSNIKSYLYYSSDFIIANYPSNFKGSSAIVNDAIFHQRPLISSHFSYLDYFNASGEITFYYKENDFKNIDINKYSKSLEKLKISLEKALDEGLQSF